MNGDLQGIRLIGGVLPSALLGRIQANELSNPQGLSGSSYHLVGNEKPRDAAARAWSYLRGAWTAWRDIAAKEVGLPGTGTARDKWLLVLLGELGYGRLPATRQAEQVDGVEYPISHRWHHVPIHLLGPGVDLDRRNPGVPGAARAPQAMLQEYLNRTDADMWGILSNGLRLRLLRDSTAFAGSAYVEFDLEAIFDGELYSEFQLLWLLCHVSRLEKRGGADAAAADCWLEEWRAEAAEAGTRALNRLRDGVESALKIFGTGFLAHPSNDWLRAGLQKGTLSDRDYHKALLRLIYRLLFAFVAEDRGALLDPAAPREERERYDEYFSTSRLRKLSRLRTGGTHPDLWRGQRMILVALGDKGMSQLGVPALGGLFDPDRRAPVVTDAPHRDLLLGAELTNKDTLAAIRRLAWIIVPGQRAQPIDYRHLGAEELGGVYESLLELVPRIDLDSREFDLVHLSGNERKTTGSYYTPPSLVSALLDASLDPALDDAVQAGRSVEEKEANLLAVTVCDPASGSGGFLVAAARRIARRLAQVRSDEDEPTPESVQHALRDVVAACIYGVDMNDLAAELAKVSLWLEALEPGKPLGFLDARIRIGNSLFGSTPELLAKGVPDKAFAELEGDQKAYAAEVRKRNKNEATGQGLLSWVDPGALAAESLRDRERLLAPSDDVDDIRARGEQWDAYLDSDARRALKRQADAWAAAFVWPLVDGTPLPPTSSVVRAMIDDTSTIQYIETVEKVEELSTEYRFFHWHLEFPEIFGATADAALGPEGWAGGFTCMLGNPPWEQVQIDPREYFASRVPEVANASTMAIRNRMIDKLQDEDPIEWAAFQDAKRVSDGFKKFLHHSSRFPLTSFGRLNTYSLFAELAGAAISPRGVCGLIVPTGIATDSFNQYFIAAVIESKSLVALLDFENSGEYFPSVHRSFKFCLFVTTGRGLSVEAAKLGFFLSSAESITTDTFELASSEIELLSPNTRTLPVFRSPRDAHIAINMQRVGAPFIQDSPPSNVWRVKPTLMFMTNTDSVHFRTGSELVSAGATRQSDTYVMSGEAWVPLREAKTMHQFDSQWATLSRGNYIDVRDAERDDLDFVQDFRNWVPQELARSRYPLRERGWVLGWRDIARSTDERTVIAAISPFSACPEVYRTAAVDEARSALLLVAMWNSFAFDYAARQKVPGTHVAFFIFNQLPVISPAVFDLPAPWASESLADWVLRRSLELTFTRESLASLARDVGDASTPFRWSTSRRPTIRAELDAAFFHLYKISRGDVDYILDTFPIVKRRDEAEFGEYRTKRLILENFDQMQECIDTGTEFVSTLDPAPGFGPRHPERTIDA